MEYLLFSVIVLTVVSIYIGLKMGFAKRIDQIIMVFLCFALFHFCYRLSYDLFALPRYIDTAFPFGLAYSPLFYFALKISYGKTLSVKKDFWHLVPFCLALIVTFFLFSSPNFRAQYYRSYIIALYTAIPLSFLGYMLFALFRHNSTRQSVLYNNVYRVFGASIIILLCMGLFFLVSTFTRIIPQQLSSKILPVAFIYLAIAGQVLSIFHYQIKTLTKTTFPKNAIIPEKAVEETTATRYQKSLVSDDMLDTYETKLEKLIQQKMYRDPDLSLEEVARKIGAPRHHITQMFNIRKGKSFNQYINSHRIAHACSLLRANPQWGTIDELAYECGFNSKASFNRNFKNIVGKTPSEYRNDVR